MLPVLQTHNVEEILRFVQHRLNNVSLVAIMQNAPGSQEKLSARAQYVSSVPAVLNVEARLPSAKAMSVLLNQVVVAEMEVAEMEKAQLRNVHRFQGNKVCGSLLMERLFRVLPLLVIGMALREHADVELEVEMENLFPGSTVISMLEVF